MKIFIFVHGNLNFMQENEISLYEILMPRSDHAWNHFIQYNKIQYIPYNMMIINMMMTKAVNYFKGFFFVYFPASQLLPSFCCDTLEIFYFDDKVKSIKFNLEMLIYNIQRKNFKEWVLRQFKVSKILIWSTIRIILNL